MSTHTPDLWPTDIATTELRSPVAILREQATLLAVKTEGLVVGNVHTVTAGEQLQHSFRLVAPSLNHYTFDLFNFTHGPSLYPVDAANQEGQVIRIESEKEFLNFLRDLFSSERTKQIIHSLIAHSRT